MTKKSIRMRLSFESKSILDNLQSFYKNQFNNEMSYSSLINIAVRTQYEKFNVVNWLNIRDTVLKLDSSKIDSEWGYQSTFMLDEDVLLSLNDMQNKFKDVFDAKRVFRAFCVRLCLKAYYIENFLDK